ncbi:MAG: DNA alkylation repair protein [Saccharospirillaceae bacterium]|nr:DNA alkylation repair protein [Saccharospirillaceae bacterium]
MAEALKDQYGPEVPRKLANDILQVFPQFDAAGFLQQVLPGFEQLELMPRGKHIARVLHGFLPEHYPTAIDILVSSMGAPLSDSRSFGMSSFFYLPHSYFIAEFGLDHFDESMAAQYQLTQRFTAEFCIRPFLLKYPQQTLARLAQWLDDPNEHVRRLISEGTRPRLPWAIALKPFKRDPSPVLELLERLKDDASLYVRRSVANNLNDIGKDHLGVLCQTCENWLQGASKERRWLVNHALRSAVKRAEPEALAVLGYGQDVEVNVGDIHLTPEQATLGDNLNITFCITSCAATTQPLLVDLVIHYVKANGSAGPKVFKLKTVELEPAGSAQFSKKVSLKNMSTRKHYPGVHRVEALINGVRFALGGFELALP